MAMTTRRYGEDEVREIINLATTAGMRDQSPVSESGELTLEEIQRIGQEAGIEPARVAHAAQTLDARGRAAPVQRSVGMPIGVSRVVELPRGPTDREWEQLTSEFRATFGAQGRLTTSGQLREWAHGDIHISAEPTEHGAQLRFSALQYDAMVRNGLGIVLGMMSVFMAAALAAAGKPAKALTILGVFGGIALTPFVANFIQLPRWARERGRQIDAIAEHAVELLSDPVDHIPQ